ncbi:MAG: ADP-ribosylglycohydrolase family protein [Nitrospirota bacterium]
MIGSIAGDIIGSVYERHPIKTKDFPLFNPHSRFTDDSVLTAAIAHAILNGDDYENSVREVGREYPDCGYGGSFFQWLFSESALPYNSWGNGSAMRVSPVGFAFDSKEKVLTEAKKTAEFTHNHPEGIKGAQAVALAVFVARITGDKEQVKSEIQKEFAYDLDRTLDDIRPGYRFDISCQGTVPEAIIAFLESTSYEDAVRNAVSLGGDSDTLACITGGIAHAYYGDVPDSIANKVSELLPGDLWVIVERFCKKFRI